MDFDESRVVEDGMNETISGPVPMVADDLPQAAALCSALSWPHRLEDLRLAFDLGHGLTFKQDDKLVGTAMGWNHGDTFATVGMIIIDAAFQGRGLGSRIFDALLAEMPSRSVILNATREGLELYRRRGFREFDQTCQHQGIASGPAESNGVYPADWTDLPAVLALDAAATGMERRNLISHLVEAGDLRALRGDDGKPRGYAICREFGRGHVIGPVIAETIGDAQALIADALSRLQGRFVRIDTSATSDLGPWLEAQGLKQVDTVEAMARGTLPQPSGPSRVFALSSQSLG